MQDDRSFIDSLKGMRIGGRYVVDKVLGAGGMGVVAFARYPELEQKVAIKFLLPMHAANTVLNARFVREARLAAKVKSEHFVRVFDIGKLPNGVPYLVMELLSGRDLGDELTARGPLPIEQAIDYVLQAAVGVAEIHALGVVHRDLKPSNLFVAEAAGKQTIKVLDFGISKENAKDGGAALTSTDNLLGTPQYMSPEQVRASKDVDARSDIWALGVILYELLTGERPFVSEENAVGELFAKVLYADPTSPRGHRPDLPEELEAVVLRCLSRELDKRYATVGELAEALRPFAAPASALRIDTVHQALSATRSIAPPPPEDEPEEVPASRRVTTPDAGPARDDPALAATSASDALLGPPARRDAKEPVTAMTSSSVSRSREGKQKQGGRSLAFAVGAALVLVGVGAFAFASRSKPTGSTTAETASRAIPVSAASSVASVASDSVASAGHASDAGTTLLPLVPDPAPSAGAAALAKSASARPGAPPPAAGRPKPAQVTSGKASSPNDLILDRK